MSKLKLENVDVKGKRVLVRVDFNVPVQNGQVIDDRRLKAAIPTISYLIKCGASKVILISHLGRPNGNYVKNMSLKPCAVALSRLIGRAVLFCDECIGYRIENIINDIVQPQIILLENLRFHKQEEENDFKFSKELSKLADLYINDAFGASHRSHASTHGVTHFFDQCAMGFLISKELSFLDKAISSPERLFVVILGGSKVSDKIGILENLLPRVDYMILGGAMLYTFINAKGFNIGSSLFDTDKLFIAKKLLARYTDKLLLPTDCLVTDSLDLKKKKIGNIKYVNINSIEQGWYGIDIGFKSISKFSSIIRSSKTIIWNGPMGIFEIEQASVGTFSLAKVVGETTKNGAISIVGGGDSALAVKNAGVDDEISHISTGGGASLTFMEGRILPAIAALTEIL